MPGETIEPTELRLLGNILGMLLDEQPGQAAAALEALRRRAAQGRISGGSLKNLFERVGAEASETPGTAARAGRAEATRLQQELQAATVQASRFAAENAALQQTLAQAHLRLARYESGEMARRRELAGMFGSTPAPVRGGLAFGVAGGFVLALMAVLLAHDQSGARSAPRRPVPGIASMWQPRAFDWRAPTSQGR